jgi:hypothetical protein
MLFAPRLLHVSWAAVLAVLLSILVSANVQARTPTPEPICGRHRDIAADEAEMKLRLASVEAMHAARLREFETDERAASDLDRENAFVRLQSAHYQARLAVLSPLAAQGNASAIFALSTLYRSADSQLVNLAEWRRLLACAAALGEPAAMIEQMMESWHDAGDGSFKALQRHRLDALDLAERSAEKGDWSSVSILAIYIAAGYHQYPVNPNLGQRLFVLCARAGDAGCRRRLIEAYQAKAAYALSDAATQYSLLVEAAKVEPIRYAPLRDAFADSLTASQKAQAANSTWRRQASWGDLKSEWKALRAEIVANDSPFALRCRRGALCSR